MSPTSYQTAPPRDNEGIIEIGSSRVKAIRNKINNLQKALILLGLSLERGITVRFPSLQCKNLEQYSLKVAKTYMLGQKHLNKGVLILAAIKDRKLRSDARVAHLAQRNVLGEAARDHDNRFSRLDYRERAGGFVLPLVSAPHFDSGDPPVWSCD
jgi:hypothetical protein